MSSNNSGKSRRVAPVTRDGSLSADACSPPCKSAALRHAVRAAAVKAAALCSRKMPTLLTPAASAVGTRRTTCCRLPHHHRGQLGTNCRLLHPSLSPQITTCIVRISIPRVSIGDDDDAVTPGRPAPRPWSHSRSAQFDEASA
jgi:hypothetical protein